jgi:hypothetical protein
MKNPAVFFRLLVLVGTAFTFTFLIARLAGQDSQRSQPLPTVQQVMDRYVGALGGRGAIFRHKSLTVRAKLEVSDKDLKLDRVVYFKEGKNREEITLSNGSTYQAGYNGTIAWQLNPGTGPSLFKGDEVKSRARDADMYYPARILDYFSSMEVVGVAEFEGHTCYHLKGTNKWGIVNEHFYDTTTGLLVGYRFNSAWRGGPGDESVVFSDYKDFGGWLMPTRIAHKDPKHTVTEVVSSVTFDDVVDTVFDLPEPVKALVGKKL